LRKSLSARREKVGKKEGGRWHGKKINRIYRGGKIQYAGGGVEGGGGVRKKGNKVKDQISELYRVVRRERGREQSVRYWINR